MPHGVRSAAAATAAGSRRCCCGGGASPCSPQRRTRRGNSGGAEGRRGGTVEKGEEGGGFLVYLIISYWLPGGRVRGLKKNWCGATVWTVPGCCGTTGAREGKEHHLRAPTRKAEMRNVQFVSGGVAGSVIYGPYDSNPGSRRVHYAAGATQPAPSSFGLPSLFPLPFFFSFFFCCHAWVLFIYKAVGEWLVLSQTSSHCGSSFF